MCLNESCCFYVNHFHQITTDVYQIANRAKVLHTVGEDHPLTVLDIASGFHSAWNWLTSRIPNFGQWTKQILLRLGLGLLI